MVGKPTSSWMMEVSYSLISRSFLLLLYWSLCWEFCSHQIAFLSLYFYFWKKLREKVIVPFNHETLSSPVIIIWEPDITFFPCKSHARDIIFISIFFFCVPEVFFRTTRKLTRKDLLDQGVLFDAFFHDVNKCDVSFLLFFFSPLVRHLICLTAAIVSASKSWEVTVAEKWCLLVTRLTHLRHSDDYSQRKDKTSNNFLRRVSHNHVRP